jgi:hypothetical protein
VFDDVLDLGLQKNVAYVFTFHAMQILYLMSMCLNIIWQITHGNSSGEGSVREACELMIG